MLETLLTYISVQNLIVLIVALPIAGFLLNSAISVIVAKKKNSAPRSLVIFISQITVLLSFIFIIVVWYILAGLEETAPSVITGPLFSWKGFLNQPLEFGLKADQLSVVIAFIMAFVGVLTHIYAVGFLSKEKNAPFYFALLNLAYSLGLLTIFTDSFFIFFVGWQFLAITGLVFINRIFSDAEGIKAANTYYFIEILSGSSFLLVMFLVWKAFAGSSSAGLDIFQFVSIQVGAPLLITYADVICIALLISVILRSLQFPFYVWMPGATKAHLPFFSLLFAVGSVLISTYILIRLNFLMVLSPKVLQIAGVIGAVGALFGAGGALVQKEAKKVLAYFVISQMGLVFVGIGVGAFAASVFHIFTHSVYVTSLAFGIGSVMAITGSDEAYEARGMRKILPVTFWTTLTGALAAAGIYPLAGFFGKNGLIWEAYQRGHGLLFISAFLSSIFVTIALFRMVSLVFFGKRRSTETVRLEESSASMLASMVIVSFASIVIGWFGVSPAFGGENHFGNWLEPGLATQMVHMIGEKGKFSELVLAVIVTIFVAHAALITMIIYAHKKKWPESLKEKFHRIYKVLNNGFYLNGFYTNVLVKPFRFFGDTVLWRGLDKLTVDGVVVGSVGRGIKLFSEMISRFQIRTVPGYVFWIVLGLIFFIGWSVF